MLQNAALLAEIVGVIGLIASLIYVGKQVQLNREQLRADAAGRYYEWSDRVFSRIGAERDFAEVWVKGTSELDELDDVDRQRVVNHEIGAIYMWAQFHQQIEKGMLPAHTTDAFKWALEGTGSRQSVREAWRICRDAFGEEFRHFAGPYLD